MLFSKEFFKKHQNKLLWLLNHPILKYWFRWCMRIGTCDCAYKTKITEIAPNYFSYGDKFIFQNGEWRLQKTTNFRTHNKYSKRMFYAFKLLWYPLHYWDIYFAIRLNPAWNSGFDTLTVYPDPNPEVDTVDGIVMRYVLAGEYWSTLRNGAGTGVGDNISESHFSYISADDNLINRWRGIYRSIFLFKTSSLGGAALISSAIFSFYGTGILNGCSGVPIINIYSSSPASNIALANSDYSVLGIIAFCDTAITYSSWVNGAYNTFSMNSTGIAAISKTGITKIGGREVTYDVNNISPPWASYCVMKFQGYFADQTGTSQDPKLVITYTIPSGQPYRKRLGSIPYAAINKGVW